MTREEAIDRFKEARTGHKEFLSVEALNMAIQALSQEPKADCRVKTELNGVKGELEPCEDCIHYPAIT